MIGAMLFLACGTAPPSDSSADPLSIQAAVDLVDVPSGGTAILTVEVSAVPGATVQLQPPSAEGLTIQPQGEPEALPGDTHVRQVFRYALSGEDGSYIIAPGAIALDDAEPIVAPPIFIDVGVDGPSGGEMVGFAEVPASSVPWLWLGLGAGALLLVGGGLLAYARRSQPAPEAESTEARARRRWRDARHAGMPDADLAVTLSAVFRDYLQERYDFPARAKTSREVIASLSSRKLVSEAARQKLKTILEASDRLKYGQEGGGDAFFDALEGSFEDILRAGEREDA